MVTVVNPGLVATEGFFPADSHLGWRDPVARPFILSPKRVARAVVDVIRRRKGPEISVPRWQAAPRAARLLAPALTGGPGQDRQAAGRDGGSAAVT